jgi:rRNA maturation protein Nop10
MALRRFLLWMTIGSLIVAAMVGVAAILLPQNQLTDEILISDLLFGGFSLVALLTVYAREKHTLGWMRLLLDAGAVLCAVSFLAWMALVWDRRLPYVLDDDIVVRGAAIATTFSLAVAHIGVVTMLRARQPTRAAQVVAATGSTIIAIGIAYGILADDMPEPLGRLLGALGIVATTATAISFIALKAVPSQRLRPLRPSTRPRFTLRVRCPRCGGEHDLPLGTAHCPGCDLAITTRIDEPHCPCGYAILGLDRADCPECGEPIGEDLRWALAPGAPAPSRPSEDPH